MYQGQVKRTYLGDCIYCGCAIWEDEEGEIIYTGESSCNCTLPLVREINLLKQGLKPDRSSQMKGE